LDDRESRLGQHGGCGEYIPRLRGEGRHSRADELVERARHRKRLSGQHPKLSALNRASDFEREKRIPA
jgi:hypothetical protein